MSYLTQMLALAVQNFLSATTGIAVVAALIRGFSRHNAGEIGNFWADLVQHHPYPAASLFHHRSITDESGCDSEF
jgi:K+-transporting ATPase ATPase A chain